MPPPDIDVSELVACYEAGAGVAKCAEKFGITYYWARKKLLDAGVKLRAPLYEVTVRIVPVPDRFARVAARFDRMIDSADLATSTRTRQRTAGRYFLLWLDAVTTDADDLSDADVLRLVVSRYDTRGDRNAKAGVNRILNILTLIERPHSNPTVRDELFDEAHPAKLPAYLRVSLSLRNDIIMGMYKPGDQLPPHTQLAKTYAVSQPVATRATRTLTRWQLLNTGTNRRTYVTPHPDPC
jgi:regulatory GntR family protein